MLVPLTDLADPRVAPYVALREASLRRTTGNLFIAEGELVVRRALLAGYRAASFLLSPRAAATLADVLPEGVPAYVGDAATVEALTGFHVHRGALAAMQRGERHDPVAIVAGARRLVVVEDVVDHANLGAIVRTAAGLGWDGLLVSHGSADPLYRRAVKASMGAVFTLPWARLDPSVSLRTLLAGWSLVALALQDGAVDLATYAHGVGAADRVAVMLGTEGHGLSAAWLAAADAVVTVPMAAGIDSLNVGAAAAIACYALRPVSPSRAPDRRAASG